MEAEEEETYDGILVSELRLDSVEWSAAQADHIRTRSRRYPGALDIEPEWATEAALDPMARIGRDFASKTGEGIRVTGWSAGAGRVLTVILLPGGSPAGWGVAWCDSVGDEGPRPPRVRGGRGMSKDMAELLAAEAAEAERRAENEDHGPSYRRKHPRRDPAQVYSLRIPIDQIEELRQLASDKGVTPSALMREWVLERIAAEKAGLPDNLQFLERLQEILGDLKDTQRLLRQSFLPRRQSAQALRWVFNEVSLDPQDEEHREIRTLITEQVVGRMEEEIAKWRNERAAGARH